MVEQHADRHHCGQITVPPVPQGWVVRPEQALTRRSTGAHLRVEEEDLHRLRLLSGVQAFGELGVEEEGLTGPGLGLDKHAAEGDVADDAAEAVGERSSRTEDRDAEDVLVSAYRCALVGRPRTLSPPSTPRKGTPLAVVMPFGWRGRLASAASTMMVDRRSA